jgi:hypothetical protein
MPPQPALLVLDDGELSDLVSLLNEIGLEFTHLRGSAIPQQIAPPERVIVTTPRRAMLTKDWPRSAPYRIAVVTEDSNTLRAMLRRVGFDLLLRRPVHPVALRLVLLRALYAGEEKRREERLSVGLEINFRSGFWRKKALLAELSQRGCRLFAEQPLSPGARINVPLPTELSPDGLTLPCKVVRVGAKPEADGRIEIGLAFENLSKAKHAAVRNVLRQLSEAAGMEEGRAFGAARQRQTTPAGKHAPAQTQRSDAGAATPHADPTSSDAALSAASDAAERRQHARTNFDRQVARLDDEANSVLLGRDLSIGGMRVEYHENLQIGDLLELAVYVSPREEPIVLKARVAHDAGDGLGLAFEGVAAEVGTRLEKLIARLPSVEALQAGETAGLGSVVSRVLSGFRRED